jgi:hypothetical protein
VEKLRSIVHASLGFVEANAHRLLTVVPGCSSQRRVSACRLPSTTPTQTAVGARRDVHGFLSHDANAVCGQRHGGRGWRPQLPGDTSSLGAHRKTDQVRMRICRLCLLSTRIILVSHAASKEDSLSSSFRRTRDLGLAFIAINKARLVFLIDLERFFYVPRFIYVRTPPVAV